MKVQKTTFKCQPIRFTQIPNSADETKTVLVTKNNDYAIAGS